MPESGNPEQENTKSDFAASTANIFLNTGSVILDRYKVLGLLGKGGMGSVFHVTHLHLQSEFALKVLNRQADITSWRRFENEAKAASRLDHPNLIKVHDSGLLPDGQPFFIMEMVKGETLADIIKKNGRLPLLNTLKIFIQVGFALAYAHESGVIHRDLKPSNIMISKGHDGSLISGVKVVDLGIAKLTGGDEFNQQTLTRTGEIFGSPLYMSPEQCLGIAVDHRSDLYSLGCSIYEALTGAPPMLGENALSTMMKHQMEKPLSLKDASLGITFPAEVETLVAKLLEKDPEKRYPNAQLLTHDLVQLEQSLCDMPEIEVSRTFPSEVPAQIAKTTARIRTGDYVLFALTVFAYILGFATSKLTHHPAEPPQTVQKPKPAAFLDSAVASNKPPPAKIKPISMTNVVPISELSADGKFHLFKFASKSIGAIKIGTRKNLPARGLMSAKVNEEVVFQPLPQYIDSPELLKRFAPNDFTHLILEDQAQNNPSVIAAIPRITRLKFIKISMDVGNEVLPFVDQLPNLEGLSVSHTKMTGAELVKLKRFSKMTFLGCASLTDMQPLLKRLPEAGRLTELKVDDSHLTREDLRAIGKLNNLVLLSIGGNKQIRDDDINELKPLTHLKHLSMVGCPLTDKCSVSLQSLKGLRHLHVSGLDKAQFEHLKAALKNVQVLNIRTGYSFAEQK